MVPRFAMAGATHQASDAKTVKTKLLLAEDEALIALTLTDALEAEGYEVVVAADGMAALDAARRLGRSIAALVTDLNMPRLGGEDLICALRKDRPELPVVVITGSAPSGGLETLRRYAGIQGPLFLLHKPIDYGELVSTLQHCFEPHQLSSHRDLVRPGQVAVST